MSNYPDGFNTRLLVEDELPDHIQDDLGRIHAAHTEIMDAIRWIMRPTYGLDGAKVLEFLTTVDQMFGELVSPIYKEIEAETGIHVERPITPEYANWCRKKREEALRPVPQNPQTHIDIAAANAIAAASVFDGEVA